MLFRFGRATHELLIRARYALGEREGAHAKMVLLSIDYYYSLPLLRYISEEKEYE